MPEPTLVRCPQCRRLADATDRVCGSCGATLGTSEPTTGTGPSGAPRANAERILEALRAATIGEYDVAGELGRGGMAVVFLAHDIHLNRKVAIKALLPDLLFIEGMDRRFKHEARIAAKLDHPNILVIYNVREANSLLYIVMKLVEGLPLSAVLKRSGSLPFPVARLIARQVGAALEYAHGEGVIHRDVKPANIMIDRKGNVVVMDFGIAKAADEAHLTQTGLVIGTPAYMSPEQCLAKPVTSASDQYSLGLVIYELLAGQTPFKGSPLEMQWAHATAEAPSVLGERADCPPEMADAIARMLAKRPEQRWPSLQDVVDAFADDAATEIAARRTLAALVNASPEAPVRRLPATPVSPVPRVASTAAPRGPAAVDTPATPPQLEGLTPPATELPEPSPQDEPSPTVTVTRERVTLEQGDSLELSIQVTGDIAEKGIAWVSRDPSIVEVDDAGLITAKRVGVAEVYATIARHRAVCIVEVTPTRYAAVEVRPSDANLVVGQRLAFSADAVTTSGRRIGGAAAVRWQIERNAIATVDGHGLVEARGAGITDVVATLHETEGRARLVVTPVPVAKLRPDPASLRLAPGKKARVTVAVLDAEGHPLRGRELEWKSSDPRVVEVTPGRVRALASGEAAVVVTCEECIVEIPTSVVAPPAPPPRPPKVKRETSPRARRVGVGSLVLLAVAGGTIWVSSRSERPAPPSAVEPAATGVRRADSVTPAPPPVVTPTPARTPEPPQTTVSPVTGAAPAVTVARLDIAPIDGTLEPGDSVLLRGRALSASSTLVPGAAIAWQSSAPRIARVSPSGWVAALAPGNASITASSQGVRRSLPIAVSSPRARAVSTDARTSRLTVGDSVQVTARAVDKAGRWLADARVVWSASPSATGAVNDGGMFRANGAGRATVVAAVDGVADTLVIEVSPRAAQPPPVQERAAPTPTPVPPTLPVTAAADSGRAASSPTAASAPALSREVARGLVSELVQAINARSAERIARMYPTQAPLAKEFVAFVRNAEPRATLQNVTVQPAGADASTIVATIQLKWATNGGVPRDRLATFTGNATLASGQWRLVAVTLTQKVW